MARFEGQAAVANVIVPYADKVDLAGWVDHNFIDRLAAVIPMLLRRGGHPLRRLHFLNELDKRGLIDERLVGSRAGVI